MVRHRGNIVGFHSGLGSDNSDQLANHRRQFIEFYHVPTDKSVAFKAFITTFSDSYASDWNDEDAFGRMDPISTFKGTRRIISLGWDVVATSEEEAHRNLERCSLLLAMLYPTYNEQDGGAQTISSSPLFKLKFLNLIENSNVHGGLAKVSGLLGKVSGFTYEPDLESGFFDPLNAISPEGPNQLYPQTIRLNCEFTVLHQHNLGFDSEGRTKRDFENFPYSHGKHNYAVELPRGSRRSDRQTTAADRSRKKRVVEVTKSRTKR